MTIPLKLFHHLHIVFPIYKNPLYFHNSEKYFKYLYNETLYTSVNSENIYNNLYFINILYFELKFFVQLHKCSIHCIYNEGSHFNRYFLSQTLQMPTLPFPQDTLGHHLMASHYVLLSLYNLHMVCLKQVNKITVAMQMTN